MTVHALTSVRCRRDFGPDVVLKIYKALEKTFFMDSCYHTRTPVYTKTGRIPYGALGEFERELQSTMTKEEFGSLGLCCTLPYNPSIHLGLVSRGMILKDIDSLAGWDASLAASVREYFFAICTFLISVDFRRSHEPLERMKLDALDQISQSDFYLTNMISFMFAFRENRCVDVDLMQTYLSIEVSRPLTWDAHCRQFKMPELVPLDLGTCSCDSSKTIGDVYSHETLIQCLANMMQYCYIADLNFKAISQWRSAHCILNRYQNVFGFALLMGLASVVVLSDARELENAICNNIALFRIRRDLADLMEISDECLFYQQSCYSSIGNLAYEITRRIHDHIGIELSQDIDLLLRRLVIVDNNTLRHLTPEYVEEALTVFNAIRDSRPSFPLARRLISFIAQSD